MEGGSGDGGMACLQYSPHCHSVVFSKDRRVTLLIVDSRRHYWVSDHLSCDHLLATEERAE